VSQDISPLDTLELVYLVQQEQLTKG